MASAEHLKALLKSHIDGDEQHFFSVAMQMAAQEARVGHGKLAEELRALIDQAKQNGGPRTAPLALPQGEIRTLLVVTYPQARFGDIVLGTALAAQVGRVLHEQRNAARILAHGLSPRHKLLLVGPPGTGKSLTASALAAELGFPLFQVRLDALITRPTEEAAAKLRQVVDATQQTRGVYFFDDFDAIGSQRTLANDVGEIRRVLNSFLQMVEENNSLSLILVATNYQAILNRALSQRFDDILVYQLPTEHEIVSLLERGLASGGAGQFLWPPLAEAAHGLSHAEIVRAIEDVLKKRVMRDNATVTDADIMTAIWDRQRIAQPPLDHEK